MKTTDIYRHLNEQVNLFEVAMNPSALKKMANNVTGALVGIEFEMVVPNTYIDNDEDRDPVEDYDRDERAISIDDIIEFFDTGDYMSSYELDEVRSELYERFADWKVEQAQERWDAGQLDYFTKWCRNNVSEQEVSDFLDLPLDMFGEPNPTKEDWKDFIQQNYDDQTEFFERAGQSFVEDEVEDGEFDEEEFLDDINIDTMQDVNMALQRSSVIWPYYTYDFDNSDRNSIENIASDFEQAIGKTVHSADSYHDAHRSPTAYSIEPDTSISHDKSIDAGLEFISHPMPVDEMIEDLQTVFSWAKDTGCRTNKSTGLHINVSVPKYSRETLDYVKLAILLGDKHVLNTFDRLANTYAKSALDIILDNTRGISDIDSILQKLKSNFGEIASKALHSGHTDKYTSINTHDEYVEFRGPGGNWLNKPISEIENTIYRCVVALDAACSPQKYKQDYYKALYKILKPKKDDDAHTLFRKFISGEISKEDYAYILEKQKRDRLRKTGIQSIPLILVDENDFVVNFESDTFADTLYIKKNSTIDTVEKAKAAAKKLKPKWFMAGNEQFVTVKPYKYDARVLNSKLYTVRYDFLIKNVVAKNEDEAKGLLKVLEASREAYYPGTLKNIIVELDDDQTLANIRNTLAKQDKVYERAIEWINSKKIWFIHGTYPRIEIAATSHENASMIAKRVYPAFEPEQFSLRIADEDDENPSDERFAEVQAQQEQIIQHNQENPPLTFYRIESKDVTRYIVAVNKENAIDTALQIYPDEFPTRASITSALTGYNNYGPEELNKIFLHQQKLIHEQNNSLKMYRMWGRTDVGHYRMVYVVAKTPEQAIDIATRINPDLVIPKNTAEAELEEFPGVELEKLLAFKVDQDEALNSPDPVEKMYAVRNYTLGKEIIIAARSEQNALGKVLRRNREWNKNRHDIKIKYIPGATILGSPLLNDIKTYVAQVDDGTGRTYEVQSVGFDLEGAKQHLMQSQGINAGDIYSIRIKDL